ncbi:hypothetical protein CAL15_04595 [Bordetella genomosp. 13]|uniref:Uncharacterized protein n=1 Tax=Bordetella genomosp. 13 TaxID=463040 RepID=A0A1W6Z8Q0_9BORD|nr:hypothetical protein CAL15_04595 [Bordetella genomosp. 13]
MRGQLGKGHRGFAGQSVTGWQQRIEVVIAQDFIDDAAGSVDRRMTQPDVNIAGRKQDQLLLRRCFSQLHVHVRMLGAQFAQHGRQQVIQRGRHKRDAQHLLSLSRRGMSKPLGSLLSLH